MEQVKNIDLNERIEESAHYIPHTPEEDFVSSIYHSIDEAADRELLFLHNHNGITPTCKQGCYECCSQYILINRFEAHALGQFIRRRFSAQKTESLKFRTRQWHKWNDNRPGRYPLTGIQPSDFGDKRPFCPLLIGGSCSAYPMRPITCRTHFVCSAPSFCRFSNNSKPAKSEPLALTSVIIATNLFSKRLQERIKKMGSDCSPKTSTGTSTDTSLDTMLLPHWLAIEMGWDFAISA